MRLFRFDVLFVFISIALSGEAHRILGLFPFHGPSHFVMFDRLMKELATRGHRVDVVSHYPQKKPFPNYTDVVNLAGTVPDLLNNMTYEFSINDLGKMSLVLVLATQFGGDLCPLMDLPKFRELIKNPPTDPPYDLVIVEIFGSTCYLALGQHLNVPLVAVVTSPMWPWVNDMVANPDNPSYIPNAFSRHSGKMDFWQRIENTLGMLRAKWEFNHYSKYQNDMIKKYIGPHAPSLRDATRNVSLVLVNSHHSLHGVRPFTTNVIEIGGLHVAEKKMPLPKNLEKWLNDSTDGFVFVSFGSMLRLETFPKETLLEIYSSLRKLAPIRVLMKIANETELPPGLPNNVFTLPWVPQIAVLQHNNVRAFVTHGGLMGTQEAVYYGVPMIGVPVYADQAQNIDLYVQKKTAVVLELSELTEEHLDAALNAVLHDPSYMESAKKLSAEFRDRPMSAIDTAIFWIEYVIRHGGTNIRSPAMDLAWWQILLIDVYGVLILAIAFIVYLLKVVIFKVIKLVSGSDATPRTKKNE